MALVVLASHRGSPGCTTTTLALAAVWPARRPAPLLVEADPDGGCIAARFALGIKPGLIELCGRGRAALDHDDVWACAQALPGGVPVVVGHPAAEQCHAALRAGGGRLGDVLATMPTHDVLVDIGRLRPASPAAVLSARADVTLVVVRPTVEGLGAVVHRGPALRELGASLVLVGEQPYGPAEVARAVELPICGVVADDARGADALNAGGGARALARSALVRSAAALAERLVEQLMSVAPPASEYFA